MARLDKFHDFMRQFIRYGLLPMKMEKDRANIWLQKALSQYQGMEEMQERQAQKKFLRDMLMQYIQTEAKGVEDLYKPGSALLSRIGEAGIDVQKLIPGVREVTPDLYEQITDPAQKIWSDFALSLEMGMYPSQETIESAMNIFGFDVVKDYLTEFEKKQKGIRETEFDWAELEEKRKRRELDERVLGVRKQEMKVAGGERGKNLTDLGKILSGLNNRAKDLDQQILEEDELEKEDRLRADLQGVQEKRDAVLTQMEEYFPDLMKLSNLLRTFRERNITAAGLEKYKKEVMKEYKLSEEEFEYLKARL